MISTPLAEVLRPKTLADFVGQDHLIGMGKPLRLLCESGFIHSMILWGPPGSGKTTLAHILATTAGSNLKVLSAVSAGKLDVKKIIDEVKIKSKIAHSEQLMFSGENESERRGINVATSPNKPTVLFLDEIHRFNKAQQDFLLPYVENGTIVLIGATTENPSFEVNSALLSRCPVYVLQPLKETEIGIIITQAVQKIGYGIEQKAKIYLSKLSDGDARVALSTLQLAKEMLDRSEGKNKMIGVQLIKSVLHRKQLLFDRLGDQHYDTISAFIKSMRASQPDASLYYLARMLEAGEDPKFIARRMIVFASEDIGLAVPTALVVANAVFEAVAKIGMPEARINLAHGVSYLCLCKKNRSAYDALSLAQEDVKKHGNLPIPLKIRNAPTTLMKELGYGEGYQAYTEDSYLPEELKGRKYLK